MRNSAPSSIKYITPEIIQQVSGDLHLSLTEKECQAYSEIINSLFPKFSKIYLQDEQINVSPFPRLIKPNTNNNLNAFSCQCDLKGSSEGKGCLQGKKIVVKDTVMIAGLPLSNGSHLLEGFIPTEDATIVQRILNAGAIIIGKSKCEDLCLSANSFTCFNGRVQNPYYVGLTPGGSSSGSAALVSGGIADIAIAGDQGGSIRIPSGSCKVIGFKPTFGLIPYTGILGIEYTFDHVGPIANETKDIALFMDATAGPDGFDQRYYTYLKNSNFSIDNMFEKNNKNEWEIKENIYYGVSKINVSYLRAWENYEKIFEGIGKNQFRIGLWGNTKIEGEITNSFWEKMNDFKQIFSSKYNLMVEEFVTSEFEIFGDLFFLLILLGLYDFLYANDSSLSNSFDKYNTFLTKFTHMSKNTNLKDVSHTNKVFLVAAHYIKQNYGSKFYVKGSNIRKDLTEYFLKVFEKYDLILLPTFANYPSCVNDKINDKTPISEYFAEAFQNCNLTCIFNVLGLPAMTIDLEVERNTNASKICPMMIVGKHFEDHRVIQFGRFIEKFIHVYS